MIETPEEKVLRDIVDPLRNLSQAKRGFKIKQMLDEEKLSIEVVRSAHDSRIKAGPLPRNLSGLSHIATETE